MTFKEVARSYSHEDETNRVRFNVGGSCGTQESRTTSSQGKRNLTTESCVNNVSNLVAKSKKAAASLFTLLHAKNCKLGVHRCAHPGCAEAKLIYLHLKTCNASGAEPCPSGRKGCADARKLLSHYRRCRDIRSRQVANRSRSQQHVCLVCSLVARQAKGSFEKNRSISPKGRTQRHLIPALNLSSDVSDVNMVRAAMERPRSGSTSPFRRSESPGRNPAVPSTQKVDCKSNTPLKMPPPPPRFSCPRTSDRHVLSAQQVRSTVHSALHVSSSIRTDKNFANEEMLSKSVDSASFFRHRAESFDSQRCKAPEWRERVQELPQVGVSKEPLDVEEAAAKMLEIKNIPIRRRRSVSCSVPSTSRGSTSGFDPILEEPVGEELQRILEGDS